MKWVRSALLAGYLLLGAINAVQFAHFGDPLYAIAATLWVVVAALTALEAWLGVGKEPMPEGWQGE